MMQKTAITQVKEEEKKRFGEGMWRFGEVSKEEELEKCGDIKNGFSNDQVELFGCCYATDGLWEFCCTMISVALA